MDRVWHSAIHRLYACLGYQVPLGGNVDWKNFWLKIGIIAFLGVLVWAFTADPPEKIHFRGGDGNCYVRKSTGGVWTAFSSTGTVTTAVEPSGTQSEVVECTPEVLEEIRLRERDRQMTPKKP